MEKEIFIFLKEDFKMEENNIYEIEELENNVEEYEESGNGGLGILIGTGIGVVGTLLVQKGIDKFKAWRKRKKEEPEVVDASEADDAVEVESKVVNDKDDESEE